MKRKHNVCGSSTDAGASNHRSSYAVSAGVAVSPYYGVVGLLRLVLIICIVDSTFSFCPLPDFLNKKGSFRYEKIASTRCYGSQSPDDSSKKKNMSAAEWARREEEKRRKERAGEVVIGKTSSIPGAEDFKLDVSSLEEQYLREAPKVEKLVFQKTKEGLDALKLLDIEKAADSFDDVFRLKPNAYLWQAGLVKFYLGKYEEAASVFASSGTYFETVYMEPATEERIWRNACQLKLMSSINKKEEKRLRQNGGLDTLLPEIPSDENTGELLSKEVRLVHRIAQTLFAASVKGDHSRAILSRARLQSIGGDYEEKPQIDRKMRKLHAWFYLGLHYDVLGDLEESKKCMKMALRLCPSGNGDDIVQALPMLHMARRDWFDDDDDFTSPLFEERIDKDPSEIPKAEPKTPKHVDKVAKESIRKSVAKLTYADLQDALRLRSLRAAGSKAELQERLLYSLLEDAGLAPKDAGFAP